MDIRDFIKKFIEQHPNTYTDKMVRRVDSYEDSYSYEDYYEVPMYRVIDNIVSWSSTKEGYYYYYFLQLRLALGVAQLFIENDDRVDAINTLTYVSELLRSYSFSFSSSKLKEGGMMISKKEYLTHKSYYKKLFDRLHELIFLKSC